MHLKAKLRGLNATSQEEWPAGIIKERITDMKIKIAEEDPNPSKGIQKKMEDIEEDQEIEKVQEDEKEENIKEHLDQNPTLIDLVLSIIHKKGIIGLTQEVNTILETLPQIKDDQIVDHEVVIMTKKKQGKDRNDRGRKDRYRSISKERRYKSKKEDQRGRKGESYRSNSSRRSEK